MKFLANIYFGKEQNPLFLVKNCSALGSNISDEKDTLMANFLNKSHKMSFLKISEKDYLPTPSFSPGLGFLVVSAKTKRS